MVKRRQQRRVDQITKGVLLVGTATLLLWALFWPVPFPPLSDSNATTSAAQPASATNQTLANAPGQSVDDAQWGDRLAIRRLQGWAIAAQPPMSSSSPSTTQSPTILGGPLAGVQLTGTIIEPGNSFALVIDRHGASDLKPVGGTLQLEPAGIRVDSIAARSIVVSFQGRQQELLIRESAADIALDSLPPLESSMMQAEELDSMNDSMMSSISALEAELDSLNGPPPEEPSGSEPMGVDN